MIRVATKQDVTQINVLRLAVHENQLFDPGWLTEQLTFEAINKTGKGWVFEENDQIVGFSIANKETHSIWALFVQPGLEQRGIGKALLQQAVNWLWQQGAGEIWLSTDPGTRAEQFYRLQGWQDKGLTDNGEVFFRLLKP